MSSSKKTTLITSVFIFCLLGLMSFWYLLFINQDSKFSDFLWKADLSINSVMSSLHHSDCVNSVFIFISSSFDPVIFLTWFFILLGLLLWRNCRYEALFLFFGVAGGQTIKIIMKFLTDRSRPENPFELSAHESSFPSGHSTTAIFFFMAIIYLFTRNLKKTPQFFVRILLVLGALLVPVSRVFVQVHFLSDVIAGIFLGVGSLVFTILVFKFLREKHVC